MDTTFANPGEDRYFEDYVPASTHEFGPILVKQDEVDPLAIHSTSQHFHSGMKAIKNTILGGALVSSWDSTGLMTHLLVDYYLPEIGNLCPPEINALYWTIPVRAGDDLSARVTVTEALRSRTEPDHGIVHSSVEILNQDRKVVMSMEMLHTALYIPT